MREMSDFIRRANSIHLNSKIGCFTTVHGSCKCTGCIYDIPKNRLLYSVALILRKGVIKRLHYYLNKQIYLTFIRHKINQQIYGHPVKMVLPATDPANLDQSATAI